MCISDPMLFKPKMCLGGQRLFTFLSAVCLHFEKFKDIFRDEVVVITAAFKFETIFFYVYTTEKLIIVQFLATGIKSTFQKINLFCFKLSLTFWRNKKLE